MKVRHTPISAAMQIALMTIAAQAHAQEAAKENPPAPPAAAASATQLEQVVVTAQKRAQKSQDVPISMSVVSAAQLDRRGVTDPLSLSQMAPALQVGDANSYSVRGIGTLAGGGNNLLEGAVATSIDGVALARSTMGNLQFADIERVEVLSGPQGMLFGKNATAGLINISTTRPRLNVTEGRVRLDLQHRTSGAAGNGQVAQATLNTPVSADSALRINLFGTHQNPLVTQAGPAVGDDLGERQKGVKLKYLWNLTSDLTVYVIGDYTDRKGAAGNPMGRTRRSFGPGSIAAGGLAAVGVVASPENTALATDGTTDYRFRSRGLQAEVSYNLGGGYSLTNITAQRSFTEFAIQDGDGAPFDGLNIIRTNFKFSQFSNELRILTPTGRDFEGQAGLFYFRSKTEGDVFMAGQLGLPGPAIPGTQYNIGGIATNDLSSTNVAVFGQGTYKLTESWRLLLGMRETRERNALRLTQDARPYGLAPLIQPTLDEPVHANSTNFTYKFGTQVNLERDVMVYLTYARGAKGPGFNPYINDPRPGTPSLSSIAIQPEKVDALELGVKSTLLDRRLVLNANLFTQKYTNLQAQTFNQTLQAYITQNAGSSRTRGVDLQMQAKPSANWLLSASAMLLDAKFTSFANSQCFVGQTPTGANGTCDATGQRLPNSPRLTYTASAEYRHPVGEALNASYEANVYRRTGVNFGIGDDPGMAAPGATLFGASVGLGNVEGDWRVTLYCRNCFDKRVPMSISPDGLDGSVGVNSYLQQFGYSSFRTVGVTGEYRF